MKRMIALCVLVTAVLVAAPILFSAGKISKDEDTIRQLNEQSLTAFDKKEAATLDKLEADDFDILTDAGTLTKQDHLKGVRAAKDNNEVYPINRTVENQKIRIYGDTAIVTQLDHASASGGSSTYAATYVWIRHDGQWKLVHLHYTKVG
jgi:ketosteroid isomerase-like protein